MYDEYMREKLVRLNVNSIVQQRWRKEQESSKFLICPINLSSSSEKMSDNFLLSLNNIKLFSDLRI